MIAIKDFKMPRGCYECPFADESIRMDCDYYCQAAKEKPDVQYGLNKPDWCPLVDVPDMNVGKCSEFPNNSDCVSRQAVFDALEGEITVTGWKNAVAVKEYVNLALDRIKRLPSVQPEIILCRDCAWSMTGDFSKKFFCSFTGGLTWAEPDSFCSYAERKKDG